MEKDYFVTLRHSELPHLDEEGLAAFEHYVASASCYLEYGAGGSTLHAIRMGARHVVSVDSSKDWIDAIKQSLPSIDCIDLLYCDIGTIGDWGRPTNSDGLHTYHAYMSAPWKIAQKKSLEPTLIFIDGRFRVACFLYSLICSAPGAIILFDDYINRINYHIVEEFCKRRGNYGRMAIFHVEKNYSLPDIIECIAKYSIISD